MIKNFLITTLLFVCGFTLQAQIFSSDAGIITFYSKAPLEDIEATSKQARCIYNTETGEVVVKLKMKSFHFSNSLMEEHFNENYIESEKYPTAVYKGFVKDSIDSKPTEDGKYSMLGKGELEIRGIKKNSFSRVDVIRTGEIIEVKAEMAVKLADYDISIPGSVLMNISETIKVTFEATLKPYQKK